MSLNLHEARTGLRDSPNQSLTVYTHDYAGWVDKIYKFFRIYKILYTLLLY